MNTKILAYVLSACVWQSGAVMAADDPPADPSLAGDQVRAARDTVKQSAKAVADAAKQGVEQATNTAKDVAHEVAASTREGAQEVTNTAKNGGERVKAAVQKNAKPAKTPPADPQTSTPPAKSPG